MSSLGIQGQFNPMTGQMGDPWPIYTQLEELFTVRSVTPDVDHIDKDVDVLMLVHPKQLPQKTLYAIDQFVMRGGRILLFIDPNSGADTAGQDPSNPMAGMMANHSSDLEPLLKDWGVEYDPSKVVGDLDLGLEVRTSAQGPPVRHIGILGLSRDDMDPKDVVTASLEKINLATAGALAARPGAKTTFEPLLLSSADAALIPAQRFNALTDPSTLRDGFKPTGLRYALAARITGPVDLTAVLPAKRHSEWKLPAWPVRRLFGGRLCAPIAALNSNALTPNTSKGQAFMLPPGSVIGLQLR